jgi:hypothetical protein
MGHGAWSMEKGAVHCIPGICYKTYILLTRIVANKD